MRNNDKSLINSNFNDLKVQIKKIITISDSIFIFRSTFLSIKNTLSYIIKNFDEKAFTDKEILSTKSQECDEIMMACENLRNLMENLFKDKYLHFLKKNSIKDIFLFLKSFCDKFNRFDLLFHLSDFPPFSFIPINLSDFSNLYDNLKMISNEKNHNVLQSDILLKRISEVNKIINYLISKDKEEKVIEDEKRRILTEKEITESLKSFSFWSVKHSDFIIENKIGSGSFSNVYFGKQISTNSLVAIKKLHSNKISKNNFQSFKHEIEILSSLHNFAIINFFGFCISPSFLIITEFSNHGNLFDWLRNSDEKTNPTKLSIIALGVACGLSYMHSLKLLHRDIKSTNILLDENDYPKICDFGVSEYLKSEKPIQNVKINVKIDQTNDESIQEIDDENFNSSSSESMSSLNSSSEFNPDILMLSNPLDENESENLDFQKLRGDFGTARWMAPEVLAHHPYDEKSDVYSYGILLWEMLTRSIPFKGVDDFQVINDVVYDDLRPQIPNETPFDLSNLIKSCWSRHPKNRPSFEMIARSFATGQISFNGADHSIIEKYVKKYTEFSSLQDPIGDLSYEQISIDLKSNFDLGLNKLYIFLMKYRKSETFSITLDLIDELRRITKICQSSQTANDLIQNLSLIFNNDIENIKYFSENGGDSALFKLIFNYSSVSMPHVIDVLQKVISVSPIILDNQQMNKIFSFLVSDEIETISLIKNLIEKKLIDDKNGFISMIIDFINKKKDAKSRILEIIECFFDNSTFNDGFIKQDQIEIIFDFILNLYSEEDSGIRMILKLLQNFIPSSSFVDRFIQSKFSELVSNGKEIEALSIAAYFVKWKLNVNLDDLQNSFLECLNSKSDDVLICALKLLVFLSYNNENISYFYEFILSKLPSLLISNNNDISSLSSCEMILAFQSNLKFDLNQNKTFFIDYLKKNLIISNRKYASFALKFCGTLVRSVENVIFLDNNGIFDLINIFLNSSENEKNQELALNIYANAAYWYPISNSLTNGIDDIVKFLQNSKFLNVSFTFLSNISVISEKSKLGPYVKTIVSFLRNCDIETEIKILTIIMHILEDSNLLPFLDCESIKIIIDQTKNQWTNYSLNNILFEIYKSLVLLETGKSMLVDLKFDEFALTQIESSSSNQRAQLLLIASKMKSKQ